MLGWYVQKPKLWEDLVWSTELTTVYKRKFWILSVVCLYIVNPVPPNFLFLSVFNYRSILNNSHRVVFFFSPKYKKAVFWYISVAKVLNIQQLCCWTAKSIANNRFSFIPTILSFDVNTLILRPKENHSLFLGLEWNLASSSYLR